MFHPDVDGHTKTLNHRKILQKHRKTTTNDCLSKGTLSQQRIRHCDLAEYTLCQLSGHHQLLIKQNLIEIENQKHTKTKIWLSGSPVFTFGLPEGKICPLTPSSVTPLTAGRERQGCEARQICRRHNMLDFLCYSCAGKKLSREDEAHALLHMQRLVEQMRVELASERARGEERLQQVMESVQAEVEAKAREEAERNLEQKVEELTLAHKGQVRLREFVCFARNFVYARHLRVSCVACSVLCTKESTCYVSCWVRVEICNCAHFRRCLERWDKRTCCPTFDPLSPTRESIWDSFLGVRTHTGDMPRIFVTDVLKSRTEYKNTQLNCLSAYKRSYRSQYNAMTISVTRNKF